MLALLRLRPPRALLAGLLLMAACRAKAPEQQPPPPATPPTMASAPASVSALATAASAQAAIDPVDARADELVARAAAAEPLVTPLVVKVAASLGGEMVKLEFRLKTKVSIVRKMRARLTEDAPIGVNAVVLDDTLRYTMRFEDDPAGHHVVVVKQALAALEHEGHGVVQLKNYWPRGDNYSGINCVLHTSGGLLWELQFHTAASLAAAARTRPWYEELRRSDTPVARKRELFDMMTREWEKVPVPEAILEPGALSDRGEIRERPRP